ncbi:hypothetical protein AQS70_21710 [Pseudomonas endophytica]|uniref:Uncharacterized protein n=1 Tax=Pseudomonas endophytica TaxID=1563157 RepID=A0A0Q0YXW8_9PSED|nr:hypothetical protein [Pseudomonas endophytica]KQB54481.1 hypothetical protein AQS70_21710 [Pseudomonas endophytica]
MLSIREITEETRKIRQLIDNKKHREIALINQDFPVMSCKLASIILAYHLTKISPSTIVYGISGIARDSNNENNISHYWIETQGLALDITSDQYNLINDHDLNVSIIKSRPFPSVSIAKIGELPNYKLFKTSYIDTYLYGWPELAEDFLETLEASYDLLTAKN